MRFSLTCVLLCAAMACGGDDGPTDVDGGAGSDSGIGGSDIGVAEADGSTPDLDGGPLDGGDSTPGDGGEAMSDGGRDPFADAGELPVCGTPPTFPITVADPGACPTFTACGGDEVGTWDFAGGCIEVDLSALSMCAGATVTRKEGFGRGCVEFDGTFGRRVGQATVEIGVHLPPSFCTAGGCMLLQNQLRTNGVPTATCTDASDGGCDCEASTTNDLEQSSSYTIEGNTIVAGSRRWDYCVAGDTMTYTDVTPGSAEPGIFELAKR